MGCDSKPFEVRQKGVRIGEIVVTKMPTGRALSLTAELVKILAAGSGSLAGAGLNAVLIGASAKDKAPDRFVDAGEVGRALATIAGQFKDGDAFVAFCKAWLTSTGGASCVRLYRGAAGSRADWIDLGSEEAWKLGADDAQKGASPALVVSGVIASIQANTESFYDTFDIPGLSKVTTTIREVMNTMQQLAGSIELLRSLSRVLAGMAESTFTPGESPETIIDSTEKS